MNIDDIEIKETENILLPAGCSFSDDAKAVIKCWENKDILACPGSGKTTVLLAKLKLLSNRMPLKFGRGICVLSHTNVAINELKTRLGTSAEKILSYPNFVGTLQTFVDQYITFPYLRQYAGKTIQVVDKEEFSLSLFTLVCKKYPILKSFINQQFNNSYSSVFGDKVSMLSSMYLLNGDLYITVNGARKKLASATSTSAKNYLDAVNDILLTEGIIKYEDAYKYTLQALDEIGDGLKNLLSKRFEYVFIDEYQDCSKLQQEVIDKLFGDSDTVLQKIGDMDQAIYNGDNAKETEWKIGEESLSIANSNRYGQEIADVLSLLRTNNNSIHSERGKLNIQPTLIIFDDDSISHVLPAFINEIKSNGIVKESGVYKAIGMYKNVSGLKIGNYWSSFHSNASNRTKMEYPDYIYKIIRALNEGFLFEADKNIRKMFCRIFKFCGIKNLNGNNYNISSIKKYFSENNLGYSQFVLELLRLPTITYDAVDNYIKGYINNILEKPLLERIPLKFWNTDREELLNNSNVYECLESGISVVFDTVFGAKGETHDATLYLETEKSRSTDIKRILPLLKGEIFNSGSDIYEKSRKCVYVGFSRPRYLLCLAIKKSTYVGNEDAFLNWKVNDLT